MTSLVFSGENTKLRTFILLLCVCSLPWDPHLSLFKFEMGFLLSQTSKGHSMVYSLYRIIIWNISCWQKVQHIFNTFLVHKLISGLYSGCQIPRKFCHWFQPSNFAMGNISLRIVFLDLFLLEYITILVPRMIIRSNLYFFLVLPGTQCWHPVYNY